MHKSNMKNLPLLGEWVYMTELTSLCIFILAWLINSKNLSLQVKTKRTNNGSFAISIAIILRTDHVKVFHVLPVRFLN